MALFPEYDLCAITCMNIHSLDVLYNWQKYPGYGSKVGKVSYIAK